MAEQATEAPEGIDRAGVEGWFEANVPDVELPLSFDRISGGRSNMTFGVRDAAGHAWALRRPPLGKRLGSAHDMGREHRVIAALQDTPVPVPPVIGLCEDESVNEAPFYVMGFVDGPILRSAEEAKQFDEDERRAIGERVVDTLVAIHEVDPDCGRPGRPGPQGGLRRAPAEALAGPVGEVQDPRAAGGRRRPRAALGARSRSRARRRSSTATTGSTT